MLSRMPACVRHAEEETKIFLLQIQGDIFNIGWSLSQAAAGADAGNKPL